jgi:hypothetical protein
MYNECKEENVMRRTLMTLAILIISLTFLVLSPNAVGEFDIKLVKKVGFEANSKLQFIPISFCVTEDEFILIPDHKAGDVKVFEMNGNELQFVKAFGPKGYGDDEFNMPAYCFYDKYRSKLGVIDIGKGTKKVYIFDRRGPIDFIPAGVIDADGFDMRLAGDGKRLIISGYATDKAGKSYELFSITPEDPGQKQFLVSSPAKYGLSEQEYKKEYFEKRTLPVIGITAYIDVFGDDVYFVWEGKLRIIKINLNTEKQTVFGHATNQYKAPVASQELLNARRDRDYKKTKKERFKLSFVRNIFATPKHVIVVYEGPNESNFRLQMYTPEGKFLGDKKIPGKPSRPMYFDKGSYTLYSLVNKPNSEKNQIQIYRVNE